MLGFGYLWEFGCYGDFEENGRDIYWELIEKEGIRRRNLVGREF